VTPFSVEAPIIAELTTSVQVWSDWLNGPFQITSMLRNLGFVNERQIANDPASAERKILIIYGMGLFVMAILECLLFMLCFQPTKYILPILVCLYLGYRCVKEEARQTMGAYPHREHFKIYERLHYAMIAILITLICIRSILIAVDEGYADIQKTCSSEGGGQVSVSDFPDLFFCSDKIKFDCDDYGTTKCSSDDLTDDSTCYFEEDEDKDIYETCSEGDRAFMGILCTGVILFIFAHKYHLFKGVRTSVKNNIAGLDHIKWEEDERHLNVRVTYFDEIALMAKAELKMKTRDFQMSLAAYKQLQDIVSIGHNRKASTIVELKKIATEGRMYPKGQTNMKIDLGDLNASVKQGLGKVAEGISTVTGAM